MKRTIRKFGLSSLVPAMALAALFSACGDDSGSNSSRGEDPSPEVAELELANGKAVVCDDDMEGVVAITADDGYRKCVDGEWIKIRRLEAMKADEIIGQLDDDDVIPNSSSSVIPSEVEGSSSSKGSGSVTPTEYVVDSYEDLPVCTAKREGSTAEVEDAGKKYKCEDGEWLAIKTTAKSSSSVIPTSAEGPGTDPESPSEVKADGYYSNSENCPAGLTCKYATTTEYLNSSKTYGEILDTRDGQVYKTIVICDDKNENCQTWMAQNLNYAYTGVAFCTSDSTSWCYDDDPSNCATYGRLYTWAAAVDSVAIYKNYGEQCGYGKFCTRFRASALATAPVRGVCPSGWHLPSNAEWGALYTNVGGAGYAGQKLKANTSLWTSYSGVTNDDSFGFSVLPAGFRNNGGDFDNLGEGGGFWSSTEYENHSNNALNLYFNYNYDYAYQGSNYKRSAFSVRCLKD